MLPLHLPDLQELPCIRQSPSNHTAYQAVRERCFLCLDGDQLVFSEIVDFNLCGKGVLA